MQRHLLTIILLFLVYATYGQGNIKYHAEWDAGFNITAPWEGGILPTINTIHGVRISDRIVVGVGIGANFDGFNMASMLPIYANTKYIFPCKKHTRPFIAADIGYSALLYGGEEGYAFAGLYFSPAVGLKKGRFKFQIGYTAQQWRFTYYHSGLPFISSAGHIRFGMIF